MRRRGPNRVFQHDLAFFWCTRSSHQKGSRHRTILWRIFRIFLTATPLVWRIRFQHVCGMAVGWSAAMRGRRGRLLRARIGMGTFFLLRKGGPPRVRRGGFFDPLGHLGRGRRRICRVPIRFPRGHPGRGGRRRPGGVLFLFSFVGTGVVVVRRGGDRFRRPRGRRGGEVGRGPLLPLRPAVLAPRQAFKKCRIRTGAFPRRWIGRRRRGGGGGGEKGGEELWGSWCGGCGRRQRGRPLRPPLLVVFTDGGKKRGRRHWRRRRTGWGWGGERRILCFLLFFWFSLCPGTTPTPTTLDWLLGRCRDHLGRGF